MSLINSFYFSFCKYGIAVDNNKIPCTIPEVPDEIEFVIIAQSVAVKKYEISNVAGIISFELFEQIKAAVKAFQPKLE